MQSEAIPNSEEAGIKIPKNCKENRYYYRHREEVLERKKQKKLENPEYQAKVQAREEKKKAAEEAKKAKEEAKKAKEEEKKAKEIAREIKRAKTAKLLGVDSPGVYKTAEI